MGFALFSVGESNSGKSFIDWWCTINIKVNVGVGCMITSPVVCLSH